MNYIPAAAALAVITALLIVYLPLRLTVPNRRRHPTFSESLAPVALLFCGNLLLVTNDLVVLGACGAVLMTVGVVLAVRLRRVCATPSGR